jgi:hypothetical protein
MELRFPSEEKLEQLMTAVEQRGITQGKDIQDTLAELIARKAVGESLLAYLNKEGSTHGDATIRSAINSWANDINRLNV